MNNQRIKVGVYVCSCKDTIKSDEIMRITDFASSLPYVSLVKVHDFLCSEDGKLLIQNDIKTHGLEKILILACSPYFHWETFRRCVKEVGLNEYFVSMVNIKRMFAQQREQQLPLDFIRNGVAYLASLKPLEPLKLPIKKSCLVVGGGISGIESAINIANLGFNVFLLERKPSIGGHAAQIFRVFPSMDYMIDILSSKINTLLKSPNIHVLTNSELQEISGFVGNFKAKVRIKPRYVRPDACTRCGECVKVCPIEVPNEFNENLDTRKAIYLPSPLATPPAYIIDETHCTKCYECVKVCKYDAIDFTQEPMEKELEVGAIIVTSGYDLFDARVLEEYGYGRYKDVITGLALERILSPDGPTSGLLKRPSDGKVPKRIAFIQCVGSRDKRFNIYCSRICCMYAIKQAILIREKYPDTEVAVFYMDIRAFGKGYEDLYERAQLQRIRFIRGKVARIVQTPKKSLLVQAEDTLAGRVIRSEFDMVVLSTAIVPSAGSDKLAEILGTRRGEDGFFKENHPKTCPVDTPVSGIYLAGVSQGPKDITDSISQALAAAQRVSSILSAAEVTVEPLVARVNEELCDGCRICELACSYNAIMMKKENVAQVIESACKGCGECVAVCPKMAIHTFQRKINL